MASLNPHSFRLGVWTRRLAYAAVVGLFLWLCARCYVPGQGFTYLVMFGGKESGRYIPELRATNFYAEKDSFGYDAQYYAQIAMHPRLDSTLRDGVDSLPYRARRILFCWTAYALGFGNPVWALHVFTVQNIIAWLLLAWVLLRWFPPTAWENFVRWFAVMFTFGLTFSVSGSLVDGPSLLLIAVGMALYERGRHGWAAAVLGVAGLGKETNILAGAVFAPGDVRDVRQWWRTAGYAVLVVAPLALWLVWLQFTLGKAGDLGARNFDWPFVGYVNKWRETLRPLFGPGSGEIGRASLLVLVALTVQWLYIALRPRWSDPWWRLGASYAVLMAFLGDAVWEGYPGAASRVLLPLTLAFNVLLPRGRRWWLVLLLGNLLVWPSFDTLVPPGKENYQVLGSRELRVNEATAREVGAVFPESEWYQLERSHFDYWRWANGPATITLQNPHSFPLRVEVRFRLKSSDTRNVTVRRGDRVLWTGPTERTQPDLVFTDFVLPPGDSVLAFDTDRPAATPPNGDIRQVAYRVCNFEIRITGRRPPEK